MTPRSTPSCPHERRPGTTVCLHCRHEQLVATRARRRKSGLRLLGQGVLAAAVVAGVSNGVTWFRDGSASRADAATAQPAPPVNARSFAVSQSGEIAEPTPAVSKAPARGTAPAIPQGRTELVDGLFAVRTGDTVTVNFDTPDARTRRSDKFEYVVRETLPVVLGEAGRGALEQLGSRRLVEAGQLLQAVEGAPIRLPVGDGRTVVLTGGTRPGQDGPLVVTYRVVVQPAAAPAAS